MLSYEQNYNQQFNNNNNNNQESERNTPSISSSSDTSSIGSSSLSSSPSHSNTPNKYVYSTPCVTSSSSSSSYQNYYNYYNQNYNYNTQYHQTNPHHLQQPNLPSISSLINNNSFDDSNYYSRNNSLNDTHSFSLQKSATPNVITQPCVMKPAVVVKPRLKFSIESILGIENDKESIKSEQEQIDEHQSQIIQTNGKKRKSMNGLVKNCDMDHDNSNKRMRTIFTQEQLDALEMEFMRQQYMVGSERSYLATALNLSESQVKIWFQNRRIKWRKSQSGQSNVNCSMRGGSGGNGDQSFDSDCE